MDHAFINGVSIAFKDSGGTGPVVLLSHGFLMDHSMFDQQLLALNEKFRVITWDERGFGETEALTDFTYWDSAKDVIGLLDHLGIDKAVVGGMSQGGFISLRVALLAPDRVRALILIDTQSGTEDPALVEGYNGLHDAWMEHGPAAVQDIVAGLILGPGAWPEWMSKWAKLDRPQFSRAFHCLMHRDDISTRLAEIIAPTLILHGTLDASIPLEKAEYLRDHLGGAVQLVALDGAPHASNLTHPTETNTAINRFLSAL